jgi:26S proteasome non-ATPase regulatory subunit 9
MDSIVFSATDLTDNCPTDAPRPKNVPSRAALRNDHAEITAEVEARIAGRMSERASETGAVKTTSETATKTTTDAAPRSAAAAPAERADVGRAFAVIDEIVSGCPGEMDGLRVGDRVCAVGDVRWGFEDPSSTPPPEAMADAARTFAANENRVVRVVVLRRGERQVVEVTPRAWSGRGLVGVHMRSV